MKRESLSKKKNMIAKNAWLTHIRNRWILTQNQGLLNRSVIRKVGPRGHVSVAPHLRPKQILGANTHWLTSCEVQKCKQSISTKIVAITTCWECNISKDIMSVAGVFNMMQKKHQTVWVITRSYGLQHIVRSHDWWSSWRSVSTITRSPLQKIAIAAPQWIKKTTLT